MKHPAYPAYLVNIVTIVTAKVKNKMGRIGRIGASWVLIDKNAFPPNSSESGIKLGKGIVFAHDCLCLKKMNSGMGKGTGRGKGSEEWKPQKVETGYTELSF